MRTAAKRTSGTPEEIHRAIEWLSPPTAVRMAQHWFEIASMDHFWVRRRFAVLQKLAGGRISAARELGEIGCGHGLLQRQVEDVYRKEVWGFDLNEEALRQNVSRRSKVCCYDVYQRDSTLCGKFEVLFLFDVLEHIPQESAFLEALLFHLAPTGSLIINVPAGQWAFSAYDKAAGHVRRYSIETLDKVLAANGFALKEWSYWGCPLLAALFLRKFWLMGKQDQREIISVGFDAGSRAMKWMMDLLSRLEWIPQKFVGTSLMAVFEHADQGALHSPGKSSGV
jgi:SAM-dependent methyltransferase